MAFDAKTGKEADLGALVQRRVSESADLALSAARMGHRASVGLIERGSGCASVLGIGSEQDGHAFLTWLAKHAIVKTMLERARAIGQEPGTTQASVENTIQVASGVAAVDGLLQGAELHLPPKGHVKYTRTRKPAARANEGYFLSGADGALVSKGSYQPGSLGRFAGSETERVWVSSSEPISGLDGVGPSQLRTLGFELSGDRILIMAGSQLLQPVAFSSLRIDPEIACHRAERHKGPLQGLPH